MKLGTESLIDKFFHSIIIIDFLGTIFYSNQTANHLFGYPENKLTGMYIDDIFGQDIRHRIKSFIKSKDERDEISLKMTGIKRDDSLLSCLVKFNLLERGKNSQILLEIIDQDRINIIEQKIFEKNNLFLKLANNLPGVVYRMLISPVVKFLYISDGIQRITGHKPSDFFGENSIKWEHIVYSKDIERVRNSKKSQLNTHSQYDLNYRIKRQDGSISWVNDQGKGQYDHKGNLFAIEGNLIDITATKEKQYSNYARIMNKEDSDKLRLARNINDGLHQRLAMAAIQLREVSEEIINIPDKKMKAYFQGIELLEQAINESRQISYELMPRSILDFGLISAIEDLLLSWEKQHKVKIEFSYDIKDYDLKDFEKNSLFIIIREILALLTRNRIDKNIVVNISHEERELHLEILGFKEKISNQLLENEDAALTVVKHRTRALQGDFNAIIKENDYIQFDINTSVNSTSKIK